MCVFLCLIEQILASRSGSNAKVRISLSFTVIGTGVPFSQTNWARVWASKLYPNFHTAEIEEYTASGTMWVSSLGAGLELQGILPGLNWVVWLLEFKPN